jgi:hypothetical protein
MRQRPNQFFTGSFWALTLLFCFTFLSVLVLHSFLFQEQQQQTTHTTRNKVHPTTVASFEPPRVASSSSFEPFANGTGADSLIRLEAIPDQNFRPFWDTSPLPAAVRLDAGIHIVTTFFQGSYSFLRLREILGTLVSNLENPEVAAVHVLWQGKDPRLCIPISIQTRVPNFRSKLVLTEVLVQPTYEQMFQYCNTVFTRGSLFVILILFL